MIKTCPQCNAVVPIKIMLQPSFRNSFDCPSCNSKLFFSLSKIKNWVIYLHITLLSTLMTFYFKEHKYLLGFCFLIILLITIMTYFYVGKAYEVKIKKK